MLLKPNFALLAWTILALSSEQAFGREQLLERDDRAVFLYPRRFGQEQPAVLQKIRNACPGSVCAVLAGQAVTPLLAAQPECSQQDLADSIIDASKQFDATTAAAMVAAAVEYRQVEKNTPPDFTKNPAALRNSVFCQKAPKNSQLNGLVQAQDPANDPTLFFDPATKATVIKGSQANTAPFGGKAAAPAKRAVPSGVNFGSCSVPQIEFGVGFDGRKETSFEPVDKKSFNHGSAQNIGVITQSICDGLSNTCKANQAAKDLCTKAQAAANGAAAKTGAQADAFNAVFGTKTNFAAIAPTNGQTPAGGNGAVAAGGAGGAVAAGGAGGAVAAGSAGGLGNFGSCSVPQIEFGVGFDGRKETSFEPVDKKSFNHGSAQNIGVITESICGALTNTCKADATAKATCAKAQAAANGAAAKTGAQADAFNAVFGKKTNFAAIAPTNGQTPAGGNGAVAAAGGAVAAGGAGGAVAAGSAGGLGNFGSCSVPQIEFGVGFDGRKETSFEPVDEKSFNHGSAQNIGIIAQFICDTLSNSCKADATAKATCAKAQAAANGAAAKTGAQADAFNAVFNIKTAFAKITPVAS